MSVLPSPLKSPSAATCHSAPTFCGRSVCAPTTVLLLSCQTTICPPAPLFQMSSLLPWSCPTPVVLQSPPIWALETDVCMSEPPEFSHKAAEPLLVHTRSALAFASTSPLPTNFKLSGVEFVIRL